MSSIKLIIKNVETNESIEFDNINYILNECITDNCQVQISTSKTIKQIGEYITSTNVDSRGINIIGYILGKSKLDMESKKRKLLNITSPFNNIQLIVDDKYQIIGKCQELVKWAIGYDNNNDMVVKFNINVLCPGTLWHSINPITRTLDSYIDEFKFPTAIPENEGMIFAKKNMNITTDIYNQCNVNVPIKITLEAIEEIHSLKIINKTSNEFFELELNMKPRDVLVINSEFGNKSVTLNGNNVVGSVNLLESTWLMLNSGLNEFEYECNNGLKYGFNAQIEYYESYWGIV